MFARSTLHRTRYDTSTGSSECVGVRKAGRGSERVVLISAGEVPSSSTSFAVLLLASTVVEAVAGVAVAGVAVDVVVEVAAAVAMDVDADADAGVEVEAEAIPEEEVEAEVETDVGAVVVMAGAGKCCSDEDLELADTLDSRDPRLDNAANPEEKTPS